MTKLLLLLLYSIALIAGEAQQTGIEPNTSFEIDGSYAAAPELCRNSADFLIEGGALLGRTRILKVPPRAHIRTETWPLVHDALGPVTYHFIYSTMEDSKILVSIVFEIPHDQRDVVGVSAERLQDHDVLAYNSAVFDELPSAMDVMSSIRSVEPVESFALFRCEPAKEIG